MLRANCLCEGLTAFIDGDLLQLIYKQTFVSFQGGPLLSEMNDEWKFQ
jgi:hypothetical protein